MAHPLVIQVARSKGSTGGSCGVAVHVEPHRTPSASNPKAEPHLEGHDGFMGSKGVKKLRYRYKVCTLMGRHLGPGVFSHHIQYPLLSRQNKKAVSVRHSPR